LATSCEILSEVIAGARCLCNPKNHNRSTIEFNWNNEAAFFR